MEASLDGGDQHPVFPQMKGQTMIGDWTSDGELFWFWRRNGPVNSLWAVRTNRFELTRSEPTSLYAGPLVLSAVVASRNGKELYAIGSDPRGELSIYDPQSSRFVPFLGGIAASYVTYSPDRQWIAYVSYPDGTLWKSRADGSDKMQLSFPPMGALLPRWSPDGKFIVFMDWFGSEHHSIYLVPSEGGQPRLLLSGPFEPADPTWSPDSRLIAYGGNDGATVESHIEILDLKTMVSTKVLGSEGLYSPRWSPDGKYIVAITITDHQIKLYNIEKQQWRPLAGSSANSAWPAWSHDSGFVYISSGNRISRINISSEKLETVATLEGVTWTSFALGFAGWFDLTPDDRIMILRDTGTEDIYALQLEY